MYIISNVNRLTRQEQLVLAGILGLLIVGLAVKVYRVAHPSRYTVTVSAGNNPTNTPAEPKQ